MEKRFTTWTRYYLKRLSHSYVSLIYILRYSFVIAYVSVDETSVTAVASTISIIGPAITKSSSLVAHLGPTLVSLQI